jgi:hypothetical protein
MVMAVIKMIVIMASSHTLTEVTSLVLLSSSDSAYYTSPPFYPLISPHLQVFSLNLSQKDLMEAAYRGKVIQRQTDRKTDRQDRQTGQADRQIDRQTDIDRNIDRTGQIDRQTDRTGRQDG